MPTLIAPPPRSVSGELHLRLVRQQHRAPVAVALPLRPQASVGPGRTGVVALYLLLGAVSLAAPYAVWEWRSMPAEVAPVIAPPEVAAPIPEPAPLPPPPPLEPQEAPGPRGSVPAMPMVALPPAADPTASAAGTPGTVDASASPAAPVADPSRLAAAAAGRTAVPETTAPRQDPNLLAALVRRGDAMFASGDVSAARLFYERAATGGGAAGATGVGKTHDPAFLSRITAFGIRSDPSAAATWYRKAVTLGDPEAERLLLRLGAAVAD